MSEYSSKVDSGINTQINDKLKKIPKKINEFYTLGEEIFSAVTHGVGALLAVAGCVLVVVFAALHGSVWATVSAAIYGSMLIMLYTMSTLYHSLTNKTAKKVFRVLDHSSVFLLIAGTYTPFCLVTLRNNMGPVIFGLVWGSAFIGIILNSINIKKYEKLSLICYLASGWSVVIAIKPLMDTLSFGGLILLLLGGISYTLGVLFYTRKKQRYMHSIWHLFVLTGSILQFFCILFYVV